MPLLDQLQPARLTTRLRLIVVRFYLVFAASMVLVRLVELAFAIG